MLTGATPDIIPLPLLKLYERVYNKLEVCDFSSDSCQEYGHWTGIPEYICHAMTILVLTDDTKKYLSIQHSHGVQSVKLQTSFTSS